MFIICKESGNYNMLVVQPVVERTRYKLLTRNEGLYKNNIGI